MSTRGEKLQDAIGLVSDEYILEAHGEDAAAEAAEAEAAGAGANAVDNAGAAGANGSGNEAAVTAIPGGKPAKKRRKWAAPLAAAACLILVLVGAFGVFGLFNEPEKAAEVVTESKSTAAVEDREMAMTESATEAESATTAGRDSALTTGMVAPPAEKRNEGDPFVLTAAEWNDNANWPFFMNLVNSGAVSFPSYGIDPRFRVKVNVKDAAGNAVRGQSVELRDASGVQLWRGVSGKDGAAYLFYREGERPVLVVAGGVEQSLEATVPDPGNQQGEPQVQQAEEVDVVVGSGSNPAGLQVMFIMDTTGSMSDELAYLQKDFASIAADVGSDGVTYSANFYRDEGDDYVTKCNSFTSDVPEVQAELNAESAAGGGDMPEAVAQILQETITDNGQWRDDCSKVAFLIFDAPPHAGTESTLDAAVRSAAERGIRLVPVVASNADRDTELFGRALSICTNGTYVFLTDDSGVGDSHLEPIVGDYKVELLHDIIVRIIQESR